MAPNLTRPAVTTTYAARPNSARILDVYALATVVELDYGREWYRTAQALADRLDPANPRGAAGVIAALSPLCDWERNMMLAIRAYADGEASGTFFTNTRKADEIMAGADPLDVLNGDKVRNFFLAIFEPESDEAVVIDRHAFDIAVGRVTNDRTRGALKRVGVYESFAAAYVRAAKALTKSTGIHHTPSQVQATTWITWRRLKGITA